MHDLDGASDQNIMFGHARDETIAHSLATSIGKDLTDGHKNSDVRRLQPEGKTRSTITCDSRRSTFQSCSRSLMDPSVLLAITYVKETAQTDLRSTSSSQVENASSG